MRHLKSAKETWGYKNITSFKNTIAESFRVSFLSTADKQSEQFGNEDTRLGSGIRNYHSNQLKKNKNKTNPNRQEADWHLEKLVAAEINLFLQEHVTHPTTHQ